MSLNPQDFLLDLQNRVSFSSEEKAILKLHADWGKEIAPEMAEHFYAYLKRDAEMNALLNSKENRIHHLHETFIQWFHEMFTGIDDWGNAYAKRRWQIGVVHVQVGIGPQHVVPAMATVVSEVGKRLKAEGKDESLRNALSKICMIDLAFIEQAYVEITAAAVLKETGWTENLFKRLVTTGAGSM
ncbi:MAG TPA: protoglobin domain-containing protein [Oculatellaceae cyanobacterium]